MLPVVSQTDSQEREKMKIVSDERNRSQSRNIQGMFELEERMGISEVVQPGSSYQPE